MKLAQQLKNGTYEVPQPSIVKPLTEQQQKAEDFKYLKSCFINQLNKQKASNKEYQRTCNFLDFEVPRHLEEKFWDIINKYHDWHVSFKLESALVDFTNWLKDEGFNLEGLERYDEPGKDPLEFSVIYTFRIRW